MWDEWEEDPDDYYNYRHQRRLSDPSANLNNYSRYGWKSKGSSATAGKCGGPGDISVGARARSENEGLDSLASELSEIEAGDLKDGKHIILADILCLDELLFKLSVFSYRYCFVYTTCV